MLGSCSAFRAVRKKEAEKEEIKSISDIYVNNSQVFPAAQNSPKTTGP